MQIEVSNGEIVDKLTILQIKLLHISDDAKRNNILKEYNLLQKIVEQILPTSHELYQQLLSVNQQLWDIEDKCRLLESKQLFDDIFIQTARSVYITNDNRAAIKKQINLLTNSNLTEEKSYQ
jgi:Family of unknown function (DUF6165)